MATQRGAARHRRTVVELVAAHQTRAQEPVQLAVRVVRNQRFLAYRYRLLDITLKVRVLRTRESVVIVGSSHQDSRACRLACCRDSSAPAQLVVQRW
jgi:hypothetical protein